jgi:hypothetical protein
MNPICIKKKTAEPAVVVLVHTSRAPWKYHPNNNNNNNPSEHLVLES